MSLINELNKQGFLFRQTGKRKPVVAHAWGEKYGTQKIRKLCYVCVMSHRWKVCHSQDYEKNNYADLKMELVLELFGGPGNQIKTDSFVWPCLRRKAADRALSAVTLFHRSLDWSCHSSICEGFHEEKKKKGVSSAQESRRDSDVTTLTSGRWAWVTRGRAKTKKTQHDDERKKEEVWNVRGPVLFPFFRCMFFILAMRV